MRHMRLIVFPLLLVACPLAFAHKPVVIDGGPVEMNTAYAVADEDVSMVGYHEALSSQPQLWFTFDVEGAKTLYLQAGVPKIDRYSALRPIMALVGPGLPQPAQAAPFALPEGYGAIVYDMADESPVVFDEEFTGTESWQFQAHEPAVEVAGKYYSVVYLPEGQEGKLWMAIGTAEQFGLSDILTLPAVLVKVRLFHEIFPLGGLLFWAMMMLLAGIVALGVLIL